MSSAAGGPDHFTLQGRDVRRFGDRLQVEIVPLEQARGSQR